MPVKYTKRPIAIESQLAILKKRGMIFDNEANAIRKLSSVNYYRLSGYWHNARKEIFEKNKVIAREDSFKENTNFNTVWNTYVFDRRLRLSIFDAIERIEIDFKAKFIYALTSHTKNAHAHLDYNNFPNLVKNKNTIRLKRIKSFLKKLLDFSAKKNKNKVYVSHAEIIDKLLQEEKRKLKTEVFVKEHFLKYNDSMPFWKSCEIATFGTVVTLYNGLDNSLKTKVSKSYNLKYGALDSILHHLNYLRNACAHHSRIWNKIIPIRVSPPKKHDSFKDIKSVTNERIFLSLSIIKYLMDIIAPQSTWAYMFLDLIEKYKDCIPLKLMGFPENWQNTEIWNGTYLKWENNKEQSK